MTNHTAILAEVADYYSAKLAEHGESARGVDWNGTESQELRFAQLCKLLPATDSFTMNDLGCGYGAMVDYLGAHFPNAEYRGYDVSADMVKAAKARHAANTHAKFIVGSAPAKADYSVASGIFNVRLKTADAAWLQTIHDTLDVMHEASGKGFAFNCLTSYSDTDKMRDYLYYADPGALFDHCKRRYSKQVALLHDYGLYEFTILVRNYNS